MKILLRLFALLKPHKNRVLIAATCLLATTGLSLAVPWFIKQTIDLGLTGEQSGFLVMAGLSVAGLGVAKALFSFGHSYLSEIALNGGLKGARIEREDLDAMKKDILEKMAGS